MVQNRPWPRTYVPILGSSNASCPSLTSEIHEFCIIGRVCIQRYHGFISYKGQYAFGPTAIGFILGALFVAAADWGMKKLTKDPTKSNSCGCFDFLKKKQQTAPTDTSSLPSASRSVSMSNEGFENDLPAAISDRDLHAGRADSA